MNLLMRKLEVTCNKIWKVTKLKSNIMPQKNKLLLIENKNLLMRKSESLQKEQLLKKKQEQVQQKLEETESKKLNTNWMRQANNIKIWEMSLNSINWLLNFLTLTLQMQLRFKNTKTLRIKLEVSKCTLVNLRTHMSNSKMSMIVSWLKTNTLLINKTITLQMKLWETKLLKPKMWWLENKMPWPPCWLTLNHSKIFL